MARSQFFTLAIKPYGKKVFRLLPDLQLLGVKTPNR
nr:MAG TPA: hypothetical protein [Caudoviricetes sp.]